jgi:hypothetical protein
LFVFVYENKKKKNSGNGILDFGEECDTGISGTAVCSYPSCKWTVYTGQPNRYHWLAGTLSACSVFASQTRSVTCVNQNNVAVLDSDCDALIRPQSAIKCAVPYVWVVTEYSPATCPTGCSK